MHSCINIFKISYKLLLIRLSFHHEIKYKNLWLLFVVTVKPRENPIFSKKWQNGNFDQNIEFFYISNDETDFTVGIVSRNLAIMSNSSNSEAVGISCFLRHVEECRTLGTL